MKKFTNFFLGLFFTVFAAHEGAAQCAASFNYSIGANGNVNFVSTSVGTNSVLTNYSWNLGNSTYTGGVGVTNPSTTYTSNGTYTVVMTFSNPCSSSTSAVITITNIASGCTLNAGLGYWQGNGGYVSFYNTTTGTVPGTTYTLNFGDGSLPVNNFTSHTYTANGAYSATLMANNNATPTCISVNVFTVNVNSICPFVPSFTYNVGVNGMVSFQSTSTGTSSNNYYGWYFGDNTPAMNGTNLVNPTHSYSNGTYTVFLSIMNNSVAPTCTASTQMTIVVTTNTCNISASFTYTTGPNGLVNFNSTSTGTLSTTAYNWNFGDGTTGTGVSPAHTYTSSGPYVVNLTAVNGSTICASNTSQNINVTTASCVANASFSVAPTNTAQVWTATPSFPWNVVAATWNWGDGSFGNALYTQHTYSASGTYSICLTVTVSCGSVATWCGSYFINKSQQDMSMIQINVVPPNSTPTGVEAYFENKINFDVYPNPTNGNFNIAFKNSPLENTVVEVYNLTGQLVYITSTLNKELSIDLKTNDLSEGIYFLKVSSENLTRTKKLIIAK